MKTRREFLKKSLFGGLAIGMTGDLSAMTKSGEVSNSLMQPPPTPPRSPMPPMPSIPPALPRTGKSAMGLRCDPIPEVRAAFIGLGRGGGHLNSFANTEGTKIVALCDLMPARIENAQNILKKAGRPQAAVYTGEEDWKKVCERKDIDVIINSTPWELHVPISLYAMKCGKHVATEVPIALTVSDCWALVDTAEQTQRHCMMLENCCYDFFELTTLNMARKGLFGEIFHGEGAYIHDLRDLKLKKEGYYKMWRLEYSKKHSGDPYPTHGLGPIAQIMNINRGDSIDYLSSMSTKQYGLSSYAEKLYGEGSPEAKFAYKMGDITQTMLHTVTGHTLLVVHDTSSPVPYDRIHKLVGTKGYAIKYPEEKIALDPHAHQFLKSDDFKAMMKQYDHPLNKFIGEKAKNIGGHGGMDYTMIWRLIYCLQKGFPLDQDVYDGVTWSCITELSEISLNNRSNSVDVPDFTRGDWKKAQPWPVIDMAQVLF